MSLESKTIPPKRLVLEVQRNILKRIVDSADCDRMVKADVWGLAIAGEAIAEAKTTAYQSAEDAEAKLATLVKLVTEIKLLPTPERLTAIKIMNEFVQSETDLANSS